ncbi:MAG: fimbrillin family protein [Bacteroidetes bacterium]|nr:fimbrillin family protein [Candidatus Colenecus caballi]
MKAIRILTAALAMAALMSCQDSGQIRDNLENGRTRTIEFSNYVGSHTRTSKKTGNSFVAGDVMAVWGDQITGSDYEEIFNGQQVSYVSGDTWTYANKRLWNPGSDYTFYAVFPYMEDPLYEISSYEEGRLFKIKNYQVPEAGTDQIDIMISERRPVSPYDKVDMIFHHMLTKIDFIFRISGDFNLLGIAYVELTKFHIEGIKKSGTFIQTAWSDDNLPVGYWENGTDLLEIPDIKGVRSDDLEIRHVLEDYLLVPQTLDDKIKFSAEFKIHYNDSTSCVITRDSIVIASLTGKDKEGGTTSIRNWETNTSYVYQLVFNPGKNEHGGSTSQPNGSISTDGNSIADIDISQDGNGDYHVDEDRDGEPDYDLVWADPDGDGTENLYPDRNGDGEPDDPSAGNLWIDTDGDGMIDTEVSRTKPGDPSADVPETGTEPVPNAVIGNDPNAPNDINVTVDEDGTYWVDEDLDGEPDYKLVWDDPDGDGTENLYPDRNGDGKPDNPAAGDLWVDTDGDGKADTEMSRTAPTEEGTDIPTYTNTIEFSASAYDWDKDWESVLDIGDSK